MRFPIVETERQYLDLLGRIAALEDHLSAIDDLRALAHTHRRRGRIDDTDLRDLAPLDDARTDVAYTLRGLADAVGEWEELAACGRR